MPRISKAGGWYFARRLAKEIRGFTLIELLIVIAVLGILAAAVLVAINPAKRMGQARDSQRKSDLAQIKNALEAYAVDHGGSYPFHCDVTTVYSHAPQPWIPELTGYLKIIPVDPKNIYIQFSRDTYVYQYQSKKITQPYTGYTCTDQYYTLGGHLEDSSDKDSNWDFTDYWGGWFVNYIVKNYDF